MAVDSAEMPSTFSGSIQEDDDPILAYKRRMESQGPQIALFGGQFSKKADIEGMVSAYEKTARGSSAAEAFAATVPKGPGRQKQTGWFLGEDNKWRFEIDDSAASLAKGGVQRLHDMEASKLPQLLQHEEVYAQYPLLKNINVQIEKNPKYAGRYDPETKTMFINPNASADEILKTVLHETQHIIQFVEGFATGTNPVASGSIGAYFANKGETESRLVESRKNLSIEQRKQLLPFRTKPDPIGNLIRSKVK